MTMTEVSAMPIGTAAQRSPRQQWRRAVQEFLWLPLTLVAAFLLLGVLTVVFESVVPGVARPVHEWLADYIPPQTAITLLSSLAGGMVTLASITFSVLLLAVFQTATAYSGVVIDQFLRRRPNQVYFGFFVGVSLYSFLTLGFSRPSGNPGLGAAFALLVSLVALVMLLILIYRTMDQMRPPNVILAIRDLALEARGEQLDLLARSHAEPQLPATAEKQTVATVHKGFLVKVDVDAMAHALEAAEEPVEVVFHVRVGHHVVFGDTLCDVRGGTQHDRQQIATATLSAITLENLPNVDLDPGYAVDQLANVAWTTGSGAQQNPEAAMAAVATTRDLINRWTAAGIPEPEQYGGPLPIAYEDGIVAQSLQRLASLLLASAGGGQHQTVAHVLRAFALVLPHLHPDDQSFARTVLDRALPSIIGQVRTHEIDEGIRKLRVTAETLDWNDVVTTIDTLTESLHTPTQSHTPASPASTTDTA